MTIANPERQELMDVTRATTFEILVHSDATGPAVGVGVGAVLPDGFDLLALAGYNVKLQSDPSKQLVPLLVERSEEEDGDVIASAAFDIPAGESGFNGSITVLIAPRE